MLKVNAVQAMSRLAALAQRLMPSAILAAISVPSPRWEHVVARRELNTKLAGPRPPLPDDLDLLFDLAEARIEDHAEVEDDSVPSANPNSQYGDYIFGGLLGAPIQFYGTDVHTWSWTEPLLSDWQQLSTLVYDPDGEWTVRCLDNLRYGVQRAGNRYGLGKLLAIEALNLCVMLRHATTTYLDIHDNPNHLRRLMAFGVDFNAQFADLQRGVIARHNEGAFGDPQYMAHSLHGGGLSMSVDAYDLCGPEIYRSMGRQYQVELIRRCGPAAYHIHGDGRHLIPEVARLPSVIMMRVQDDMHEILPRAFERRRQLREMTGDVPLSLPCTKEELLEGIRDRSLPGGVMYATSADSIGEANSIMKRVWEYEAPSELSARPLDK